MERNYKLFMKLLNIYTIRIIGLKYIHLTIYRHFHLCNIKIREIIKTHFLFLEDAKRQRDRWTNQERVREQEKDKIRDLKVREKASDGEGKRRGEEEGKGKRKGERRQ